MNLFKSNTLSLFFSLLWLPILAQKSEPVQLRIYYTYTHQKDSIALRKTRKEDMVLFIGQNSKKAIGQFEGQEWTVYFTEDIPFPGGPYKLQGLPGLIIQAQNKDKSILYEYAALEDPKTIIHKRLNDITQRASAQPGDYNALDQVIGRDMGNAYFENYIRISPGAIKVKKEQLEKLIKIHEL